MFPPVSSIEKGGEHGSCTYICEKLFRADADFLSVVISDTKGNLSEIFSFFCQRARDRQTDLIITASESIEYQEKGENIFEQYLGKVDQKEE